MHDKISCRRGHFVEFSHILSRCVSVYILPVPFLGSPLAY